MTRFAPVDLSLLPAPEVIEPLDFEAIFETLRAQVIAAAPELAAALALESEPATKVLQVIAWSKMHDRARVNDAARAVMLPFATGGDLEVLAALFGVTRTATETDARLRERTRLALQAYSSAGPAGAYRYHAISADPRVRDVRVDSPDPGAVRLVVLAEDNDGVPDTPLLTAVIQAVTAEDVRVLTDTVSVIAATPVDFEVEAALVVEAGAATSVVLEAARAALDAHLDRRRQLGLRITLTGLIAALHVEGVEEVLLAEPAADIEPEADEFARATDTSVILWMPPSPPS